MTQEEFESMMSVYWGLIIGQFLLPAMLCYIEFICVKKGLRNMRILLAEDEADLNQIITRKLTSDGYSVDSCYNGSEAIDFLEMADYDAVILDIMMPKIDG